MCTLGQKLFACWAADYSSRWLMRRFLHFGRNDLVLGHTFFLLHLFLYLKLPLDVQTHRTGPTGSVLTSDDLTVVKPFPPPSRTFRKSRTPALRASAFSGECDVPPGIVSGKVASCMGLSLEWVNDIFTYREARWTDWLRNTTFVGTAPRGTPSDARSVLDWSSIWG